MSGTDNFHSLVVDVNKCYGCVHCMKSCPTEAIRIRNGKASISNDKCIGCGNCLRACPINAIDSKQDSFETFFEKPKRVALIPSVFWGQFPTEIPLGKIIQTLYNLGFTDIIGAENSIEIIHSEYIKSIQNSSDHPIISSFCPAVVKLIQLQFPGLCEKLGGLQTPAELAATYARIIIKKQNFSIKSDSIAVYYFSPCPAMTSVMNKKNNAGFINGVFNIRDIYNKVLKQLHKENKIDFDIVTGSKEWLWTLSNGETDVINNKCLAIDQINNVTRFLERLENEDMPGINFLELRSCDQSCAGGSLNSSNRFLVSGRLKEFATQFNNPTKTNEINLLANQICSKETITNTSVTKGNVLDEDVTKAIKKLKKLREVEHNLPAVDCGLCGSPTCRALAEDVALENAKFEYCVFLQRRREIRATLTIKQSVGLTETIWGKDKI